jgi:hypothetical protein
VNKLASMFNDITLSKTIMNEFKDQQVYKQIHSDGVDFSTEVLTNGHWPKQQESACIIPHELKEISIKFENFYKKKYPNRNLSWLLMHG